MNTKSIFLLCMWLFATCFLQAQDKMPQAISYQAIARDAQGKVVSEKTIGVKVEILKGSADGSVVFSETHTPTSSKTGTVNLLIGQGTAGSGTFASINWGADTYFLQLSMDLAGGSNYEKVSTTQMLPVPYALYASRAGTVENGGGTTDPDGKVPFLIYAVDSGKHIYEMISGEVKSYINDYSNTACLSLEGGFLYLNGKDQQLSIAVEGLPIGTEMDDEDGGLGQSTVMGRCFDFSYNFSANALPYDGAKLVVRNALGQTVKEYPFKIVKDN